MQLLPAGPAADVVLAAGRRPLGRPFTATVAFPALPPVQASKANDNLAVILATEKDGKRLIDYYGVKLEGKLVLVIEDPKVGGGAGRGGG